MAKLIIILYHYRQTEKQLLILYITKSAQLKYMQLLVFNDDNRNSSPSNEHYGHFISTSLT